MQNQQASSSRDVSAAAQDRRGALLRGAGLALLAAGAPTLLDGGMLSPYPAAAFTPPPPGYRAVNDKLDGYRFFYPDSWIAVTSSGNDIFLRNPRNIDENIFVDLSSPSSSR